MEVMATQEAVTMVSTMEEWLDNCLNLKCQYIDTTLFGASSNLYVIFQLKLSPKWTMMSHQENTLASQKADPKHLGNCGDNQKQREEK